MRRSSGQRRGRVGSPQTPTPQTPRPLHATIFSPRGNRRPISPNPERLSAQCREQMKLYGRKFDRSLCKVIYLTGSYNTSDDENSEDAE